MWDVIEFLRRRGLADAGPLSVTALSGGFWNDNVRVRGPGLDWVVKRYRRDQRESLFPNLPGAEARALEVLRGHGVAPEPVAFVEDADGQAPVLIYEFWPGETWRSDVRQVAHLLRRLHAVPAGDLAGFRHLPMTAHDVLLEADQLLAALPPEADGLATTLRSLRPPPDETNPPGRRALVHTDVGAGNLIVGPGGVRLIDWQCPGLGDPAQDLWAFLSPAFQILFGHAPLTPDETAAFLAAYGDPATAARMGQLAPSLAFRMAAYCCLRARELAAGNPSLSDLYARAAAAQII